MLWSALFHDRARLVDELAKRGTTPTFLAWDFKDTDHGSEYWTEDQLLLAALVYFGDQGYPQPAERTERGFYGRTPDWEQLSPLEDRPEESAAAQPFSNDPPGMRRAPGPEPTFHRKATIGAALGALSDGVEAAKTASGLHAKDVLRAEKILRWEWFRWDGVTLWVDPVHVRQRGERVALRVLSRDRSEWRDPLDLQVKP